MSAVTVNSRTYSDDSNPATGLGNGGHRTRLIPLFSDALTEISNQVAIAAQAYRATSTSTVTIGAGSKTFIVTAGRGLAVGDIVVARQSTNASTFMAGAITAFNTATGALTLSVSPGDFGGSGAISDWVVVGPIGPRGLRGLAGLSYGWDSSTSAGDPGAGLMRANNAALASATALYIDNLDASGVDVAAQLTQWGASSSVVKGRLILRSQTDPAQQIIYDVTAVAVASGYCTLTVIYRGGAASFAAGVAVDAAFSRTGDRGDVANFGQSFQFDAATTAADPGPGKIRFNNVALSSATAAYVDVVDWNGSDVSAWLAALGAGLNAQKGVLRLQSMTTLTKFAEFGVSAAANSTGYYTLSVSYLGPAPAPVFAAGEPLALLWSRAGDKGDTGAAGTVSNAGDGSVTAPGFAFFSETGLGLRRKSPALMAVVSGGADQIEFRFASQAEAEAGTNTLALMNPLRVLQSIRRNQVGNVGGQTATGDLVLTATSAGAIVANPSAPGFFATLPAANTLPTAGPGVFSIYNAGDFDYGIRDNAGTRLGWIPPRSFAVIDAVDVTTAAGVWNCQGAEKLGVTASFSNTTITNLFQSGGVTPIDMGSNRTLFLIAGSDLYGVVYDGATRAWGNLTFIRSGVMSGGSGVFAAIQTVAGAQALVCSCDNATGFQTVVLTIATTTITVGTSVATTLGGSNFGISQIIAVGSSFVVAYGRTPATSAIRAITISGTTPTIGAEAVVSTASGNPCSLYASGSVVRAIMTPASGSIIAAPYTVSGTTLTAGTSAVISQGTVNGPVRSYQNSNGNIVLIHQGVGQQISGTVLRLTGATEAASTAVISASTAYVGDTTDVIDLGGGKSLVAYYSSTSLAVNILTDTAGTATVGTNYFFTTAFTMSGVACLHATSSLARVAVYGESGAQAWMLQHNLNVSGASPTLSAASQLRDVASGLTAASSDRIGRRRAGLLRAGANIYVPAPLNAAAGALSLLFTANAVAPLARPRGGIRDPAGPGVNEFQSWFAGAWANSGVGLSINQLECAA